MNSVTTSFAYNGDGLRDSLTTGGSTTTFTWDVNRGIPQVLDDEDLRYVYGIGRIAQIDGGDTFYYLSDGLGSTMALTDDDGDVVNDYDYDVFGGLRDSSGSQDNDFTFAGEQVDGSTGLQYLRARYYDMATGRFLNRDPLSTSSLWGGHPFAYANGLPTGLTDATGLDPDREPEGIAFPPPGTLEDQNRCRDGWIHCMFEIGDEMKRTLKLTQTDISGACGDFYVRCLDRVRNGQDGYFEFDGVRERMRSIANKSSLIDDIFDRIPRVPLGPPRTGSGGLLGGSKEGGSFTLCLR